MLINAFLIFVFILLLGEWLLLSELHESLISLLLPSPSNSPDISSSSSSSLSPVGRCNPASFVCENGVGVALSRAVELYKLVSSSGGQHASPFVLMSETGNKRRLQETETQPFTLCDYSHQT